MLDMFGKTLEIGDNVVYPVDACLCYGTIARINDGKFPTVIINIKSLTDARAPNNVIKLSKEQMMLLILENE